MRWDPSERALKDDREGIQLLLSKMPAKIR